MMMFSRFSFFFQSVIYFFPFGERSPRGQVKVDLIYPSHFPTLSPHSVPYSATGRRGHPAEDTIFGSLLKIQGQLCRGNNFRFRHRNLFFYFRTIMRNITHYKYFSMKLNNLPTHPGLLLRETLVDKRGFTVTQIAKMLNIGRANISVILNGHAAITPNMALRIETVFNISASSLLQEQLQFNFYRAKAEFETTSITLKLINDLN